MRHAVGENDPAALGRPFAGARPRDVYDVVVGEALPLALPEDVEGDAPRVTAQDPPAAARGVFGAAQRQEQHGAEYDPEEIERPEGAAARRHVRYHNDPMTRAEIEEALLEIVRNEKDALPDAFSSDTPLADAGIDSLDALTILFAIEEHFKISIPDERARAMKTFGDMVDAVEALVAAPR